MTTTGVKRAKKTNAQGRRGGGSYRMEPCARWSEIGTERVSRNKMKSQEEGGKRGIYEGPTRGRPGGGERDMTRDFISQSDK